MALFCLSSSESVSYAFSSLSDTSYFIYSISFFWKSYFICDRVKFLLEFSYNCFYNLSFFWFSNYTFLSISFLTSFSSFLMLISLFSSKMSSHSTSSSLSNFLEVLIIFYSLYSYSVRLCYYECFENSFSFYYYYFYCYCDYLLDFRSTSDSMYENYI